MQAITFHRCKNLKFSNVMVINSQQMHIAFTKCFRVVASNLKVIAPVSSPNTDGIHISASSHIQVKDSMTRTGDDCISIVSNSSEIQIGNIACGPGHGIRSEFSFTLNLFRVMHVLKTWLAFVSTFLVSEAWENHIHGHRFIMFWLMEYLYPILRMVSE